MDARRPIELETEKLRLLYQSTSAAVITNAVLVVALGYIFRPVVDSAVVLGWWMVFAVVLLGRAATNILWRSQSDTGGADRERWLLYFRIGVVAAGLAWAGGTILLFLPANVPYQAFLAMALAGVCAGAVTTLAVDLKSIFAFLLPTLLPIIILLLNERSEISIAMGMMILLFLLVISLSALRSERLIRDNVHLHIAAVEREMILKKAAAELNTEKERAEDLGSMLQTVLDTIPMRIFWKDRSLHYLGCNRLFALDAGGNSPDDLRGKDDYSMSWREMAERYRADDKWVIESGQSMLNFEEPQSRTDGKRKLLRTSKAPLRHADGEIIGVLGTYEDITEEKRIEEDLLAAKKLAESASLAKSEFLASMSHELKTPLNAILGYSYLLSTELNWPTEVREQALEIERAGNHLLSLVNDLIDLSRIESGKIVVSMKPESVKTIIEMSLAMVEPLASHHHIRLVNEANIDNSLVIRADVSRLRQVLLNFLSNAIKYNIPNGEVRISVLSDDDKVRVSVADTGKGIPQEKQQRIFSEAFDRLGKEYGSIEGTGIGLVITKRIAEAMGGSVGFDSEEGKGSTFWVEMSMDT